MREIKFRAWDKDQKIMLDDVQSKQGYLFRDFLNNPRFEVMQFTGLNDKNGTEICGGDIVDFGDEDVGIVIWDSRKAKFEIPEFYDGSQDYPTCAFSENFPYFEIIGNIYENPELLKG